MYNTNNIRSVSQQILSWYDENKRDLPWRRTNDPYKIWLSEIMLQQTQVDTVIPYYNKWVKRFQTIDCVADSNADDILKLWEGLGYYSRGRNFHKSALIIKNQYDGIIPQTYDAFKSLPGVGSYTANMVLSIVLGEPRIAIDGNIRRIGFRLLGLKRQTPYNIKRLEVWFNKMISQKRPGDFNQALMDLGSSVCKASTVKCNRCPVSKMCRAYASSSPLDYPQIIKKKKIPHYNIATGLIWQDDSFYIQKRSKSRHLRGLWEFPGGKIDNNESEIDTIKRRILEECHFEVIPEKKIGSIKHVYSHFSISINLYHCTPTKDIPVKNNGQMRWIKPKDIPLYAFPKANHKLFQLLKKQNWNRDV